MNNNFKKLIRVSILSFIFILVFITNVQATNAVSWRSHSTAIKNKSWTIKLNKKIDKSSISLDNVKVIDKHGNTVPVNITLNSDYTAITVYPKTEYSPDDYTLIISDNLKSADGSTLGNSINFPFSITNFKLGNENLFDKYYSSIMFKNVGLITNQSGIDSNGQSTIDKLFNDGLVFLKALYGPEHGIDGNAKAGEYVKSYIHEKYKIPVYSLYGDTRKPTKDMLNDIDALIFDIQDIGSRSYTYKSTLYKCMEAAKENNKEIIVLDRPNPLGGITVSGPVLESGFESFVGIDKLPVVHGMTIGELAKFFNRNINAKLTVIPMEGYKRNMIFKDTGLDWIQTSPYIPNLDAVYGYSATGQGDGTGIGQSEYFTWVGGKNIDSNKYAHMLNSANLPGVEFIPSPKGSRGGVKLKITDYYTFDPARIGIYTLGIAKQLNDYTVPKSSNHICFFDLMMGSDKIGNLLENKTNPKEIEESYIESLEQFKVERQKYLIYK